MDAMTKLIIDQLASMSEDKDRSESEKCVFKIQARELQLSFEKLEQDLELKKIENVALHEQIYSLYENLTGEQKQAHIAKFFK